MCSHCGYDGYEPGEEEEMRNQFDGLTTAEKNACEAIAKVRLSAYFMEFFQTIEAEDRASQLDPRNRDDLMRHFGSWLAHYWPEFASND